MNNKILRILFCCIIIFCLFACDAKKITVTNTTDCTSDIIENNQSEGCSGEKYPDIEHSLYILPYPPGLTYPTGLTNCSSSFHGAEYADKYAFDFNMPNNSDFHAIRSGKVVKVVEDHPNKEDETAGNFLVIDHLDGSFGLYYHSPPNGILVEVGEEVIQGQKLGVTGMSGYAGYPHLHLIVVSGKHEWPYTGIPVAFKNVKPRHTVLKSNFAGYTACNY